MKAEYTLTIRPRRLATAAALMTGAMCLAGIGAYNLRGPLASWLVNRLVDENRPELSDAIVVLAGATPEREVEAADMYLAGYAKRILITEEPERLGIRALRARGVPVPRTIDTRRGYLRAVGVPDEAIIVLEPPIISTMQEAERVATWAQSHDAVRSLIIVTTPLHTRRARYTFERALRGTGITLRVRATKLLPYDPDGPSLARVQLREWFIEWQKMVFYQLRYCCT